jgi:hypothetical protein
VSEYRRVFFLEIVPDHWVNVTMKGDFDSDMFGLLHVWRGIHALRQ